MASSFLTMSNPGPLQWDRRVLATGAPGKSQKTFYKMTRADTPEEVLFEKMPSVWKGDSPGKTKEKLPEAEKSRSKLSGFEKQRIKKCISDSCLFRGRSVWEGRLSPYILNFIWKAFIQKIVMRRFYIWKITPWTAKGMAEVRVLRIQGTSLGEVTVV